MWWCEPLEDNQQCKAVIIVFNRLINGLKEIANYKIFMKIIFLNTNNQALKASFDDFQPFVSSRTRRKNKLLYYHLLKLFRC